jgi:hypothetical protein
VKNQQLAVQFALMQARRLVTYLFQMAWHVFLALWSRQIFFAAIILGAAQIFVVVCQRRIRQFTRYLQTITRSKKQGLKATIK